MRALAERELAVHGFEPITPGLEAAFWAMAAGGPQTERVPARAAA